MAQLNRTTSAVEAAEATAKRVEREAATRHLLVLMTTLDMTEQALESAVANGHFAVARRELAAWRARASEIQGVISVRTDIAQAARDELDRSIALAAGAKGRLLNETVDIVKSTAKARQEIARCVQTLSEVAGRLKAYADEEEQ